MKKLTAALLAIVMLVTLFGCQEPAAENMSISEANINDAEYLSKSNNTFALDLYHQLQDGDGNLFFSPYSISSALGMTYAGARGETEKQMAAVLHFQLPQEQLHPAFANLAQVLAGRSEEVSNPEKQGFTLRNVNALWGQQDFPFKSDFLNMLEENYGAGLKTMDFVHEPEASRLTINDWASEQTAEKIKDLIPPGGVDSLTRLVLTNAIYFKADWLYQFNRDFTHDGEFSLLNGDKITVPMMPQIEAFHYASGHIYQAIELPYEGKKLSMVILLPEKEQFEKFETSLDYKKLKGILDSLQGKQPAHRKVSLAMPKFKFTSDFGLRKTLSDMGMPAAFDSATADFSGMTGAGPLWIDNVIHKAFVAVDENGTEAAAATAVIMVGAAPIQYEIIDFTMDRPFIFLIRDIETNTILFLGRVVNPLE